MRREAALQVLQEASQDRRIKADLNIRGVRKPDGTGYRVNLLLVPKQLTMTIVHLEDWHSIKLAWKDM
jgi:CxxC motif-containing protein